MLCHQPNRSGLKLLFIPVNGGNMDRTLFPPPGGPVIPPVKMRRMIDTANCYLSFILCTEFCTSVL